jgi:hypothetical protein
MLISSIMKKSLAIIALFATVSAYSQTVGVGTDSPNENAALHVHSQDGDQGVLVPRLKGASLVAMAGTFGSAEEGMLVYNVDDGEFQFWDGAAWESVGGSGATADDLGDHIADSNIALNDNYLSGDGDDEGVYVDADGNVSIGTSTSNLTEVNGALDVTSDVEVNGDVTADDFSYSARVERIMSVSAASWILGSTQTAQLLNVVEAAGLQSGSSNSNITASLMFPDGAQITKVECYVSNVGGTTASLQLYRKEHESNATITITGNVAAGVSQWVEVSTASDVGLPWGVSNKEYNYFLLFNESVPNPNIRIEGCRVFYSVAGPQ